MTTANILMLVDDEQAFERYDIPQTSGGCLYVPGGEQIAEPAARLIQNLSNGIVILPRDYHPKNHISFMENHPGVMEDRSRRLRERGMSEQEVEARVTDVLTMPFDDILLKKDSAGKFRAVAFKVGNEYRAVDTDINGYITTIRSENAKGEDLSGSISQTLWRVHGVQYTRSSLFADAVMAVLPEQLRNQLPQQDPKTVLRTMDDRANEHIVIPKGTRSDCDSYGVGTENDQTTTQAPAVFAKIAKQLAEKGVTEANIYVGGLATNFCVEFSHDDIYKYLVPALQDNGIKANVYLLTNICRGIPISVPGGAWPDLDASGQRMAAKGTKETTTEEVIRTMLAGRAAEPPRAALKA